jgi:D-alanine-D-alanine ligase-like ATP-grasp enzyme/acylphosphatase
MTHGGPTGSLEILHVELLRYDPTVAGRMTSRAIVRLTARTAGGARITGTGEGRLEENGRRHGGWDELVALTRPLLGAELDLPAIGSAPASVAAALDPVLPPTVGVVTADAPTEPPASPAGVRLALELALLDTVTRTHGCDLPTLLGRQRQAVAVTSGELLRVSGKPEDLETLASRCAEPSDLPVVRMRLSGVPDVDLEAILTAARADEAVGRRRPLWLTAVRELEDADEVVDRLGTAGRSRSLPPLWLSAPVAEPGLAPLVELQARALAATGQLGALRVMPRVPAGHPDLPTLRDGDLGGVELDLGASGSALDLLDAVDHLSMHSPTAHRILAASHTTSEIGAWAVRAIAACAGFDHTLGVRPRATSPWLTMVRGRYRADTRELMPLDGPGMTPELDPVDLAPFVSARVTIPEVDDGVADRVRPINLFPRNPYSGPSAANQMFQLEALAAGLSITRHDAYLFTADDGSGRTVVGFERGRCDTSAVAQRGAWSKELTKAMLETAGFHVPSGAHFEPGQRAEARAFGRRHGYPLVVKPVEGRKGVGITTDITDPAQLDAAIDLVEDCQYRGSGFIVERYLPGADYRILVLGHKVLSIVEREPAHVIGDGHHTIAALVAEKNIERRKNHHLALGRLIEFNDDALRMLELQGLHPLAVPELGRSVVLRSVGNQSAGGESIEVLDETHPSIIALAIEAVGSIPGLVHAGLDVLLDDHRAPVDRDGFRIIEINDSPAMGLHHWVMFGRPRNVTRKIVGFYARRAGLDLAPRTRDLCLRLTIEGAVTGVGYRAWLANEARKRRLDGWVANTADGKVAAVLAGRADRVSATVGRAIRGPVAAAPVLLRCVHERAHPGAGFAIRDEVLP